jgi:predicted phage-related endonuclease
MGANDLRVLPPETDRRVFLGGSDIAAVMALGATYRGVRQTALTVWQKKVGEVVGDLDPADRKFLDRRKRWEGPIVQMLREEFRAEIVSVNRRLVASDVPYFACEIDFEWRDENGEVQNGEIKTVSPFAYGERHGWGEEGTADIPVHYYAQVMWGLAITGRKVCIVAAMVGLDAMVFYRVERDEEAIAGMLEQGHAFWNDYVIPKVPPPPQSSGDIDYMLKRLRGRPALLDGPTYEKLLRMNEVRASLRAMTDEEEDLAFAVGDFICQAWQAPNPYVPPEVKREAKRKKQPAPVVEVDPLDAAELFFDGRLVATWKKQGGAYLDQTELKKTHPDLVAEFTRRHVYRVLRVKAPALSEESKAA